MKDRLAEFLKSENLTAVKFAEILDIQPSSVSHIISGRNKPGFDFISKLLLRFPDINPDWLINGSGRIYRSNSQLSNTNPVSYTDVKQGIFTNVSSDFVSNTRDKSVEEKVSNDLINERYTDRLPQAAFNLHSHTEVSQTKATHQAEEPLQDKNENASISSPMTIKNIESQFSDQKDEKRFYNRESLSRNVKKIILLYDDNSYEVVEK